MHIRYAGCRLQIKPSRIKCHPLPIKQSAACSFCRPCIPKIMNLGSSSEPRATPSIAPIFFRSIFLPHAVTRIRVPRAASLPSVEKRDSHRLGRVFLRARVLFAAPPTRSPRRSPFKTGICAADKNFFNVAPSLFGACFKIPNSKFANSKFSREARQARLKKHSSGPEFHPRR